MLSVKNKWARVKAHPKFETYIFRVLLTLACEFPLFYLLADAANSFFKLNDSKSEILGFALWLFYIRCIYQLLSWLRNKLFGGEFFSINTAFLRFKSESGAESDKWSDVIGNDGDDDWINDMES